MSYGEDIAGQAYSSYAETPGDAGGNDNFVPPTTIRTTDPTVGFDVEPPPSQRLNLIDRLSGGIRGIKDFFGDPDNRTGILSGLIGSALFGPFGGILAGSAGQRFAARNNNLLTGMNTIDYDNVNTPPFALPETKPFFINQNIGPQYADASKTQLKDFLNILNPDFKLDEILDEEEKKQKRQQELLNEILIG